MQDMVGFSEQVKKPAKSHIFKDSANQMFVATILVTYVTIIAEPDFPLQN